MWSGFKGKLRVRYLIFLCVVLFSIIGVAQVITVEKPDHGPFSQIGNRPVGAPNLGDGSASTTEPYTPKAPDSTAVPQPTPRVPSIAQSPFTTERQQLIDQQLLFLRMGHLVYRPPSPIRVADWRRVVVRVSGPSAPPDFMRDLPGSGSIRDRNVRVGSDLIADLTGPDFNIVRVGGDDGKRTLATGTFAEWQWDVQPLHSGQKDLFLVLYVRLTDGGPPLTSKRSLKRLMLRSIRSIPRCNWLRTTGQLLQRLPRQSSELLFG